MPETLLTLRRRPDNSKLETRPFQDTENTFSELVFETPPVLFLEVCFEETLERIRQRLQFSTEPDGSFGGSGYEQEQLWQIVGMLVDAGSQLAYVDLQGNAPAAIWKFVFQAILETDAIESKAVTANSTVDANPILSSHMVFLKEVGRYLDIDEFFRWLDRQPPKQD